MTLNQQPTRQIIPGSLSAMQSCSPPTQKQTNKQTKTTTTTTTTEGINYTRTALDYQQLKRKLLCLQIRCLAAGEGENKLEQTAATATAAAVW